MDRSTPLTDKLIEIWPFSGPDDRSPWDRAINSHRRLETDRAELIEALRGVLAEVTPGVRPESTDSWLPPQIVERARALLSRLELANREDRK